MRKKLETTSKNVLVEYPTGYGKSKLAIDYIEDNKKSQPTVLIVAPRLVLKQNWIKELEKWKITDWKMNFVTYVSLPKIEKAYDFCIFDEAHHISERCIEALSENKLAESNILLSATVTKDQRNSFKRLFPELDCHKITTKKAIQDGVLPDPTIYLLPLELDNTNYTYVYTKGKGKTAVTCKYNELWKYKKQKNIKLTVFCTQRQFYNEKSNLIEWYKKMSFGTPAFKNMWLQNAGKRLKWLAEEKTEYIKTILQYLKGKRVLTFCNNIEQTEILGNGINCKQKDQTLLNKFNNHEIDTISACNMLDEGVNLVDCQIGLYAALNSSERMITQKLGRILRHKNPIIIIPYFTYTRDEEIVNKMLEDYNPELIKKITNIKEIEL